MKKIVFLFFIFSSTLIFSKEKDSIFHFDRYEKKQVKTYFNFKNDFYTIHSFWNSSNPDIQFTIKNSSSENFASLSDNTSKTMYVFSADFKFKNIKDLSKLVFLNTQIITCYGNFKYYLEEKNPLVIFEKSIEDETKVTFTTFNNSKKQKNVKEKFIFIYSKSDNIFVDDIDLKNTLINNFNVTLSENDFLIESKKYNKDRLIYEEKILESKKINFTYKLN